MIKHLSLLSILHYVYGALVCVGGFIALFAMGFSAAIVGNVAAQEGVEPPPDWLAGLLGSMGLGIFLLLLTWGILIILSGVWIGKRSNRTASIVIAALCLISFPIGTALGVFALVALSDDEVKAEYAAQRSMAS
jgi:hypothetical protein